MVEYLQADQFDIDSLKNILGVSHINEGNWDVEREELGGIMIWNYFEREIDFDTKQFLLEYQDQTDFADYEVSILYNLQGSLVTIINKVSFRESELLVRKTSEESKLFFSDYNAKYHTNINRRKVRGDFLKLFEFGSACGVGGSATEMFSLMLRAVNAKKINKLNNWLRSPNINLRLFGAVGILWLSYDGRLIESQEKEIIRSLWEENYSINSCSGCSPETSTIEELLDKEQLKYIYEQYKK